MIRLPGQKPAFGAQLNRQHPHAHGLLLSVDLLEGGGQTIYDSVGGRQFVGSNSPTWNADNTLGFAAASNQDVALSDATFMNGLSQLTMGGSFRRRSSGVQVSFNRGGLNQRCGIHVWFDGNVYFTIDTGAAAVQGFVSVAGTDWHTCVMRFDGSQATNATRLRGWIDGVEQTLSYSGASVPATTPSPSASLRLGRNEANSPFWSDGWMGWGRLWGAALAPDLISEISRDPFAIYDETGGRIRRAA